VASSVQWMSSMTRTSSVARSLTWRSSAPKSSSLPPPVRHSRSTSPPSCPARSNSGPSGRGLNRLSHAAPGPAGCWQVALELLEDGGFTDSRLAAQQDEPAVPVARLACQARQVGECLLPFQQLDAASVRHAPAGVTLPGW